MKTKLFFTAALISVFLFSKAQSFKNLYNESFSFLELNDYKSALPILLEMQELQPNNANVNFSIGNCYMNSSYEKTMAIPYYEKAQNDLTIDYVVGSPREKKAPLDVIQLLGQAYHQNYEFDKAIERYEFYKQFLNENNLDEIRALNRMLRISKFALEQQNNPVNLSITHLKYINTEFPEYRPKLNAEENLMFFTSRRSGGYNTLLDEEGKFYEDIYMAVKKKGVWSDPILIQDRINTDGHDACLYLSPDAQLMYVYRNNAEDAGGGGIYQVNKEGDRWGELQLLQSSINSEFWETDASLDTYGNIIFFTSDREGGYGGRDIWMMKKLPNGDWAEAQNLGENVNTVFDEEGPYLHPDGKTLYFSSQGHSTMGGHDFFKSNMKDDGTFTAPQNLGYPLNTVENDLFFFPSVSGNKAYFSSYREGGKGDQDIYVMNLNEEEESDLAVYKGVVKDTVGNVVKNLVISIFEEENKYGIYRPNELTGRFLFILQAGHDYEILYQLGQLSTKDYVDVPLNTEGVLDYTKVVTVEDDTITITKGKVVDGDIIAIAMLDDMANLELINTDDILTDDTLADDTSTDDTLADDTSTDDTLADDTSTDDTATDDVIIQDDVNQVLDSGEPLVLDRIYFKYESATLIKSSKTDLEKVYNYLKNNPSTAIKIIGHTDSNGDKGLNLTLSQMRANAVRNSLNKMGVSWSRMSTAGMGESKPIAKNKNSDGSDNPQGRQKNRRVEFQIVK